MALLCTTPCRSQGSIRSNILRRRLVDLAIIALLGNAFVRDVTPGPRDRCGTRMSWIATLVTADHRLADFGVNADESGH